MTYDELDRIVVDESEYEDVLFALENTVAKVIYLGSGKWRVLVYRNNTPDRQEWVLDYKNTMKEPTASEMLEAVKIALKRAGSCQDISYARN